MIAGKPITMVLCNDLTLNLAMLQPGVLGPREAPGFLFE